MSDRVRSRVISKVHEDVRSRGASDLESIGWLLVSILEGREDLVLRGHDERGHFVRGIADAFTEEGDVIVECGAGRDYFDSDLKKPIKDVKHALELFPNFKRLYLFSTENVPVTRWGDLVNKVSEMLPDEDQPNHSIENGEIRYTKRRVQIFDGIRIARTLFDRLSKKTALIEQFEQYLSSLSELVLELSYENAVPKNDPLFMGRESLVDEVRSRLLRDRICALYGISGAGKTEVASAVARGIGSPWPEQIWVDASAIEGKLSFASVPIQRIGRRANLLFRIKEEKTIVIVDDWRGSVRKLANDFLREAHETSVLLVTTQHLDYERGGIEVPGLDKEATRRLLVPPSVESPSKILFDKVLRLTGGNPLALRLLRDLVEYDDVSWANIEEEVNAIGDIPAGSTTLARRVLERHESVVRHVIPAIGFLNSSVIEANLFREMVGHSTFVAVRQRGILRSVGRSLLQVHELVRTIAGSVETQEASDKFWDYIARHLPRPPYHLTRAINIHRHIVIDAAKADCSPGLKVRAYFNLEEAASEPDLVELLSEEPLDPSDWATATSVIEAMEVRIRLCRDKAKKKKLCRDFAERIEESVEGAEKGSLVHLGLLHHAGKLWLWASEREKAIMLHSKVLGEDPEFHAARLQLARGLTKSDPARARDELRKILELVDDRELLESSSITVVLAAYEELSDQVFHELLDEFLFRDSSGFEAVIDLAITENFAQPYSVVASLMNRVGYRDPEFVLGFIKRLALPEPAIDDDRLNRAAGRIEIGRHDALRRIGAADQETLVAVIEKALGYFGRVQNWPDPDEQRDIAKALHRLGHYSDALAVLEKIPDEVASPFVYYDRAKAYCGLSRWEDGLRSIESAMDKLDDRMMSRFRSTFLRLKGMILAEMGKTQIATEVLAEAINVCSDEKFRGQMEDEVQSLKENGYAPDEWW